MTSTLTLPRVYPIVDAASLEARALDPVPVAQALIDGGAQILQFRFKGQLTAALLDQALAIAEACRTANVLYVVNDRADVALLAQAALHLGQDDLPPEAARKLMGPEAIIGFSTHNADQMRAASAEPVNYVAFGPIFSTASKLQPDPTTGLERLAEIRTLTPRTLVAIGGITRATAPSVWAAGADSVAIIADLLPDACTLDGVTQRMREWTKLTT
jgi:thiamine-phosphate pyrophosphorylase